MWTTKMLRVFLDDLWVRFRAHVSNASAHHAPYTDAEVDAILAVHTAIAAAHHTKTTTAAEILSGVFDDARIPAAIARDSEVSSAISTHAGLASAHHVKYTDTEAVSAVEAEADLALKLFGSATQPRVWAYRGSDQTIPDNTWTTITWLNSRYNVGPGTDLMWSSTTNPSRLTAKVAGLYLVYGYVGFDTNATGQRVVEIYENGSTELVVTKVVPSSTDFASATVTCLYPLAANDYVELRVYQGSGGDLNVRGSSRDTSIMAVRVC